MNNCSKGTRITIQETDRLDNRKREKESVSISPLTM